VDCACTFPMRGAGRSFERAYIFRAGTQAERLKRVGPGGPYPDAPDLRALAAGADADPRARTQPPPWLAWTPRDLLQEDLADVVAGIRGIDHSVRAVEHMPGGSRAGYTRWDAFRQAGGLREYGARRNNAMDRNGVSRLSAYNRWGMVSPFKIAADALADRSSGARKFLDEFLVWRELCYTFCAHREPRQVGTLAALPRWAQDTLEMHKQDQRQIKSNDELEKGKVSLWSAICPNPYGSLDVLFRKA